MNTEQIKAFSAECNSMTLGLVPGPRAADGDVERQNFERLPLGFLISVLFLILTTVFVAMILISIGSGGITALQYFIVVTAVSVSLILLPSFWVAPKIARELAAGSET